MGSAIRFAAHKMSLPPTATPEQRTLHREWMLFRALNMKSVVAVVGSGCTISLGYPMWCCFVCRLLSDIAAALAALGAPEELQRIEDCRRELATKEQQSANRLMYFIGVCQNAVLRNPRLKKPYADSIRKLFAQRDLPPEAPNPCSQLVRLPIYRFVTTNYDVEIERALSKERDVLFDRFGIDIPLPEGALPLSFTQAMQDTELLTRFSLARDTDNRNMVFHCHGRFDQIDSIIASENDYQRWYVADEAGPAFRQTLELLLESNPLLFVGYGMRDEDLLRPLRQLGALDPARKASRPIFALVYSDDLYKDNPEHELLYERYGLQVIPFQAHQGEDQGTALCRTLRELNTRFLESCDDWYEKPCTRPPRFPPRARRRERRRPLLIPAFDPTTRKRFAPIEVDDLVKTITGNMKEHEQEPEERPKKASVICLVGPGGTGKSLNLLALLQNVETDFEGAFYWNTHYTNEAFTVLDHAVRYMVPAAGSETRPAMRQTRLLEALASQRFLVVVDGCERLLRPARRTWEGRAYSAGLRQIFRILAEKISNPGFRSIIVFAGRLWPGEILSAGAQLGHEVVLHYTERIRASRLKSRFPGDEKQITALCSLLRGHSYGLLLAQHYLEKNDFQALLRKLAEQPPKKRFDTMMKLAVEALEDTEKGARALLERMALFTEPVSEGVVKRCWKDVSRENSALAGTAPAALLNKAVEDRFVLRVLDDTGGGRRNYAYVVHSSLRGHFRRRDNPSHSFVPPDFAMPGYTARTNGVDPGSAPWAKRAESLFETLCEDWEDCLVPPAEGRREGDVGDISKEAAECSRAAFGILRTQWECVTASRQKNFDDYGRIGIRLTNRIRVASPGTWSYCDPAEFEKIETKSPHSSPLFVAELAWLYNDVAFGLFGEGLLPDAFAVWEQAYEVSRVLESTPPYGEYVAESLLNLTHTLIELGQLVDAVQYLDEASRLNAFLQDEEVGFRILGFRGFCEHIRGSLRRADELYTTAIAPLAADGNRRAASFFLTLQAEAVLELGDVERAAQLARESRALAEIGDYPDLVSYARIPEADVLVRRGDLTEARRGYEAVLHEARRMRARAIEAFSHLKLAELSLVQGDTQGARRLAMKTLKASNELGLGLLSTRALITLARATVHSGDQELGLGYLKIAKNQARQQQYGLRLRDAERYLRELGEEEVDRRRSVELAARREAETRAAQAEKRLRTLEQEMTRRPG